MEYHLMSSSRAQKIGLTHVSRSDELRRRLAFLLQQATHARRRGGWHAFGVLMFEAGQLAHRLELSISDLGLDIDDEEEPTQRFLQTGRGRPL